MLCGPFCFRGGPLTVGDKVASCLNKNPVTGRRPSFYTRYSKEDDMTFEQLEKKYGKQERVDWKQHENGGGWVHKNATITDKVFVGEDAIVWSGEIYGGEISG